MKTSGTRWGVVIVVVAVIVIALLCCVALAAALGLWAWSSRPASGYGSNGEQIYFTSTSQRGTPISHEGGGIMMMGGRLACVNCHGEDGRGGQRRMMMRSFETPDIRYRTLTTPRVNEKGEVEPIFDDQSIRQAITRAVDPDGSALEWPMPRWSMSAADLDDLLDYLKQLP